MKPNYDEITKQLYSHIMNTTSIRGEVIGWAYELDTTYPYTIIIYCYTQETKDYMLTVLPIVENDDIELLDSSVYHICGLPQTENILLIKDNKYATFIKKDKHYYVYVSGGKLCMSHINSYPYKISNIISNIDYIKENL